MACVTGKETCHCIPVCFMPFLTSVEPWRLHHGKLWPYQKDLDPPTHPHKIGCLDLESQTWRNKNLQLISYSSITYTSQNADMLKKKKKRWRRKKRNTQRNYWIFGLLSQKGPYRLNLSSYNKSQTQHVQRLVQSQLEAEVESAIPNRTWTGSAQT